MSEIEKQDNEYKKEEITAFSAGWWDQRWKKGLTGWDIGYPSPPITGYMAQYSNKDAAILIPGCGNAYEAEYLAANGFSNITLLDISAEAARRAKVKFGSMKQITVINEDFFRHKGTYDLILEQTFFCALAPENRSNYPKKAASLLNNGGRLAGVLFGIDFPHDGPPFGGSAEEYRRLFSSEFKIHTLAPCYNSIKPRSGSELFINLTKK